jgi:carbon storage regulator
MIEFLQTLFLVACVVGGAFVLPLIVCWRPSDRDAPGTWTPRVSGRARRPRTDGHRGRLFPVSRRPELGVDAMGSGSGNGMLVLSRKTGEEILIGDDITVTVLEINGTVRLGVNAPRDISVDRLEVRQSKRRNGATRNVG